MNADDLHGKEPECTYYHGLWICLSEEKPNSFGVGHTPTSARDQWRHRRAHDIKMIGVIASRGIAEAR